jgi:protein CLEC16A
MWIATFNIVAMFSANYIFSNEHINFLIAYPFDFRIEEMLSYYISFLRFVMPI